MYSSNINFLIQSKTTCTVSELFAVICCVLERSDSDVCFILNDDDEMSKSIIYFLHRHKFRRPKQKINSGYNLFYVKKYIKNVLVFELQSTVT